MNRMMNPTIPTMSPKMDQPTMLPRLDRAAPRRLSPRVLQRGKTD